MRIAEKVPDGVLHVVGEVLLAGLELLAALVEAAGVVQRNAALPVSRRRLGFQFEETVEVGQRFVDAAALELLAAAPLVGFGARRIEFDALAQIGNGLVVMPQRFVSHAAQRIAAHVLGIGGDRLAGQFDGFLRLVLHQGLPRLFQIILRRFTAAERRRESGDKQGDSEAGRAVRTHGSFSMLRLGSPPYFTEHGTRK